MDKSLGICYYDNQIIIHNTPRSLKDIRSRNHVKNWAAKQGIGKDNNLADY